MRIGERARQSRAVASHFAFKTEINEIMKKSLEGSLTTVRLPLRAVSLSAASAFWPSQ